MFKKNKINTSNENREIMIDIVSSQIAEEVDKQIRQWNIEDEDNLLGISAREPIKIYINSIGGNIKAAITILDAIKLSKTPVYTINIGDRQKGRIKGHSIIDTKCDIVDITNSLNKVISLPKKDSFDNPYYQGKASQKAYTITKEILKQNDTNIKEFYDMGVLDD